MSKNLAQVFAANPVTTIGDTDLLYVDQGATTDAAITGANLKGLFPSRTGTGASGTWGINISGNAATATSASTASTASAVALSGITGLGTGVATALAINVGSAGAFIASDGNNNVSANNFNQGYVTTVTAAGTTTLTVGSAGQQYFTGSTTQTVTLPVTSTLVLGQGFYIVNNSSGVVTVNSSGGNTVKAMAANSAMFVRCILTSGTTAASWDSTGYIVQSSGGSNPWSAGAGTGSAIGGDGSNTCTGNYSFSFGSNSNTNAGQDCFAMGYGNVIASGPEGSLAGGFQSHINIGANWSICWGASINSSAAYTGMFGNNFHSTASRNSYGMAENSSVSADYTWIFGVGFFGVNHKGVHCYGDSQGNPNFPSTTDQWSASFNNGYQFNVGTASTPFLAVNIDNLGNLINLKGIADQSYSLQVPTTGFNITIVNGVATQILNPAGTLATGTIIMPSAPVDGQKVRISTTQTITALTVSGNSGQTVVAGPTTLTAGSVFTLLYVLAATSWYPA